MALVWTSALMFAFEVARMLTEPAALGGGVFERGQRRPPAAALPRLVPNRASRVLKRKFCDSMPMVLKASVTPTEMPFEIVVLLIVA